MSGGKNKPKYKKIDIQLAEGPLAPSVSRDLL